MNVTISRSSNRQKKWTIVIQKDNTKKTLHIGSKGMQDYTMHGDDQRKSNYLARHKTREDWTANGITTAGFWSRWLLWNKKTLTASKSDIKNRFNVKFN